MLGLVSPSPRLPVSLFESGGAKQNTSVLQIGFAPIPVPMMSRITPPTPVFAPPYGSKRRWMIVRLDFERHVQVLIESHDARVVFKHTHAPIIAHQVARGSFASRQKLFP